MWERSYRQEEGGSRSGETIDKTRVREKTPQGKLPLCGGLKSPVSKTEREPCSETGIVVLSVTQAACSHSLGTRRLLCSIHPESFTALPSH